jgi:hypothetical protein
MPAFSVTVKEKVFLRYNVLGTGPFNRGERSGTIQLIRIASVARAQDSSDGQPAGQPWQSPSGNEAGAFLLYRAVDARPLLLFSQPNPPAFE